MKRLMALVTTFIAVLISTSIIHASTNEIVYLDMNESNNYTYVELLDTIDITKIRFSNYYGRVSLDSGVISNMSSGLSQDGNIITVTDSGVQSFEFTYQTYTNRIYFISKDSTDIEYDLYSEDFDNISNGSLPTDFYLTDGAATVQNGALELNSILATTKFQFPSMTSVFSDYTINLDFSFQEVYSSSRWISVVFRAENDSFYQLILRQGGTLSNGVELAKSTNGSVSSLETVAFSSVFNLEEQYNLNVEIVGSSIRVYINDNLVLSNDELTDFTHGFIGVQSNGNIATVDNLKVSNVYDPNSIIPHNFVTVPRLFKLESNASKTPSIVKYIETKEDVLELSNSIRPHTAIFTIDDELNVLNKDGSILMTAYEALLATDGIVIPAFEVNSLVAAENIGNLLQEHNIIDVFVVSNNYEWILAAHLNNQYIRGVLKVDYDDSKPELSEEDMLLLRDQANTSFSYVVMLPLEYANQEHSYYFHKRFLSTWVIDDNSSEGESSKAIFSGADGIVTTDEFMVISVLQKLPENTSLSKPVIIGHRGMPTKGPENTVEGSQLAVDSGAEGVELDIRLTSDDKIVVMHDANTIRTTGVNMVIANSTLAELTAIEINVTTGQLDTIYVPSLEDYFIQFQDQDNMLTIEIKDANILIVTKLKELIEQYPKMKEQVTVIAFDAYQLEEVKRVLPEYSTSYLNGTMVEDDTIASIENTMRILVPMGARGNIFYSDIDKAFMNEFNHRGIAAVTWTINDPATMYEYYLIGAGGFTTNNSYLLENSWLFFNVDETTYDLDINLENTSSVDFAVKGMISTPAGAEYPHIPVYEIIDPDETGIEFDASNNLVGATSVGTVYVKSYFTSSLPDGTPINIFADVIKINVTDSTVSIEDPVIIDEVEDDVVVETENDFDPLLFIPIVIGSIGIITGGFFVSKKIFKF